MRILPSIAMLLAATGCAASRQAGHEQTVEKQRFAIVYSPGPNWVAGKPFSEQPLMEHGNYMHQLYLRGKLLMGGPFTDNSGGLVAFEAADQNEAQRILENDPALKAGIFTAKLHPWFSVDWAHYGP
jgi:uncharacterized protein YciI